MAAGGDSAKPFFFPTDESMLRTQENLSNANAMNLWGVIRNCHLTNSFQERYSQRKISQFEHYLYV